MAATGRIRVNRGKTVAAERGAIVIRVRIGKRCRDRRQMTA